MALLAYVVVAKMSHTYTRSCVFLWNKFITPMEVFYKKQSFSWVFPFFDCD